MNACLEGNRTAVCVSKREKEHVEIYARRARINSKSFRKINQILHDKTCFTDHDLIMSNRTRESNDFIQRRKK